MKEAFRRDGAVLMGASAILFGRIGRAAGLLFPALLAAHTVYTYLAERRTHHAAARMREARTCTPSLPASAPGILGSASRSIATAIASQACRRMLPPV
jgi:hypothetical protein